MSQEITLYDDLSPLAHARKKMRRLGIRLETDRADTTLHGTMGLIQPPRATILSADFHDIESLLRF
jgi:hypothetical protein